MFKQITVILQHRARKFEMDHVTERFKNVVEKTPMSVFQEGNTINLYLRDDVEKEKVEAFARSVGKYRKMKEENGSFSFIVLDK